MSILKKRGLVLLPTNKAENALIRYTSDGRNIKHPVYTGLMWKFYPDKLFTQEYLKSVYSESHHLYVISDEEITDVKVGDYMAYDKTIVRIRKELMDGWICDNIHTGMEYGLKQHFKGWKKVIASTDKSLTFEKREMIGDDSLYGHYSLPTLRESFIEKYIQAYNAGKPIEWVNVEYEEIVLIDSRYGDSHEHNAALAALKPSTIKGNIIRPKLRMDNTIITHPIQDSFSREEVIDVLSKFAGYNTEYTKSQATKWFDKHY